MLKQIECVISWKYFHVIVYSVLSLAIIGRFLSFGYILTLDMGFTPKIDFVEVFFGLRECLGGQVPYLCLLHIASEILPTELIQKVIFFMIFFISGLSAHNLCPAESRSGRYFAGLIYMVNPFIYVRFLAGHYYILLAHAIVPFAVFSFLRFLEIPDRRSTLRMIVCTTLVAVVGIHTLFLLLFLYLVIFSFRVVEKRRDEDLYPLMKYTIFASGLFLLLNFYWIFPILTADGSVINQIGSADIMAFAPRPASNFNIAFTMASMYGFWRGGYTYTKDLLPFWYLFFFFILFLVVHGSLITLSDKKLGATTRAFVIVAVVALFLGIGASSDGTAPIFNYMFENVPIFKGFRDSHKFVALLVLAYAYLGGLGVDDFAKQMKMKEGGMNKRQAISMIIIVSALISPLIYTHTIFGFHDQLKPVDYPESWYEVNDLMNSDEDEFNILFLPWHAYMDFQWIENRDKRLGTPANSFFDKPVILGDNMEIGGIYSQSADPISKYIEFLLQNRDNIKNFGELVAPINVRYIVLVEEVDYRNYDFLYSQEDLELIFEGEDLIVFRNKHETAKIYEVNTTRYIKDYEELLEVSREEDITSALYLYSDREELGYPPVRRTLNYTMKSPVYYEVDDPRLKYVIFTTSQHIDFDHWDMNGAPMIKNMGLTPAFMTEDGAENIIKFTRFYNTYLPGYIISLVTFITLVFSYYQARGRED